MTREELQQILETAKLPAGAKIASENPKVWIVEIPLGHNDPTMLSSRVKAAGCKVVGEAIGSNAGKDGSPVLYLEMGIAKVEA